MAGQALRRDFSESDHEEAAARPVLAYTAIVGDILCW